MDTLGRHLLVEFRKCDCGILNDVGLIENLMRRSAIEANTTIVSSAFKRFVPQGVSGVVIIEESHLSIHTWPEKHYAAVDFYTCGKGDPFRAFKYLKEGLKSGTYEILSVTRGLLKDNESSILVHGKLVL